MPKLNSPATDKQDSALDTTAALIQNIVITTNPVVITAVQRKANIGNFENLDIYMAVATPLNGVDVKDTEAFHAAISAAAEEGFSIAAMETAIRYHKVKGTLEQPKK